MNQSSPPAPLRRAGQWLKAQRQSTRLSFVLQLACRILMSVCSLAWTPLLLGAMGRALNGTFLNLASLSTLGGLGDLGMGGTVSIHTSRELGQGRAHELPQFLAAVRGFFLVLTVGAFFLTWGVAPHLFATVKFDQVAGIGSLSLLGLVLAASVVPLILNSYAGSLNYGIGNVLWPIVPGFLLLQAATLAQFLLARQHEPLWIIFLPVPVTGFLTLCLSSFFVRISHPVLGTLLPLRFDLAQTGSLLGKSFWVYLFSASSGIYLLSDQLMVSHGFGPGTVPLYVYNMKLSELAMFAINSACVVSLPKITQWFASPDVANRDRARSELERLTGYQIILGCAAALVYLTVNDTFVDFWLGPAFRAPFPLEVAFAGVLVITAAGQGAFSMATRCCEHGIRVGGVYILCAALLNLVLSYLAMRQGWLWGVAAATVVAQIFVMLSLGRFTAREMRLSWWKLTVRNCFLGCGALALGAWEHFFLQSPSVGRIGLVIAVDIAALLCISRLANIGIADLRRELEIFDKIFRK